MHAVAPVSSDCWTHCRASGTAPSVALHRANHGFRDERVELRNEVALAG